LVLTSVAATSPPLTAPSASSAGAPVDTVTLSQAAQQSLATGTVAAPDNSSQPDAVTQAIATLNDTSGTVSVTDQLQAYRLLAQFVQGPQYSEFVANFVPGEAAPQNDYTAAKGNAIVALIDSPFGQHVQQVLNQINGLKQSDTSLDGNETAASIDTFLAAFNALSPTDQQIYVGAVNLSNQLVYGVSLVATPADYVANQQAQADVDRALQTALSNPAYATAIANELAQSNSVSSGDNIKDLGSLAAAAGDQATVALANLAQINQWGSAAWTQQAQAYFAEYGPPPAPDGAATPSETTAAPSSSNPPPDGAALNAALATTWDTTGDTSVTDQAAAEQTVRDYFLSDQNVGPARIAIGSLSPSPFENAENAAAAGFFWQPAVMAATSGNSNPFTSPSELALLNAQPLEQQELIFAGSGFNTPGFIQEDGKTVYYATLADWKAALAQQAAASEAAWENNPSSSPTDASVAITVVSSPAPTSKAAQALANLTAPSSNYSSAAVGLKLLQNATKAATAAKAEQSKTTSYTASIFAKGTAQTTRLRSAQQAGSTVSVTA
jgi:hypothetical protein